MAYKFNYLSYYESGTKKE
uniref:Uncharacterized protein n=1 Tax=Rhizophora mucronata TaxID=61149 RepID=A0A2P2Q143_RHIMU